MSVGSPENSRPRADDVTHAQHAPSNEKPAGRKVLSADEQASGMRLDQWLALKMSPEVSRARIQGLIRKGFVSIDDQVVTSTKTRLSGSQTITVAIPAPEPAAPPPQAIELDIVFEDEHLIVINKPAGLVVHPGAGNPDGTLVNALIHHCGESLSGIGGVRRPGIVHRLDKDTSGIMVAAKTDHAHRLLSESFADHGRTGDLERAYCAIAWGMPNRMTGTVDAPLGRSNKDRTRRAVVSHSHPDARHAVTHFKVIESFGVKPDSTAEASLIECRLETGRTHQIRVHMSHIGHPLIGDSNYGQAFATKANRLPENVATTIRNFHRQALHAHSLAFRHPVTGKIMHFEAPLPPDILQLYKALKQL